MTAFETVRERSRSWYWLALYGALLIGLGLLALANPFASSFALGIYLAWALIVSGAFGIAAALRTMRERGHGLDAILGIFSVAAGFVVLMDPLAGAVATAWAIGLWFAVSGASKIVAGIRVRRERAPLIVSGLVDLLLFALFWISSAWVDLVAVSVLVAVSLVAAGVVSLGIAWRLRGLATRLGRR